MGLSKGRWPLHRKTIFSLNISQSGNKSDKGMPHLTIYACSACLCVSLWWHMSAGVACVSGESGERVA